MPSLNSSNADVYTLTSHPDVPPFPSPQTFDILPEIYALIARLQLPTSTPPDSSTSRPTESVSLKDLPAAAVPIKLKIQKARGAVQALPDMGRTVVQQEREIRALEVRNEALKERVRKFARLAGDA